MRRQRRTYKKKGEDWEGEDKEEEERRGGKLDVGGGRGG